MTLPDHSYYCLQFGWQTGCPICAPEPLCKNCGHGVSAHSFTDEPTEIGWCPKCRGCGPRQQEEQPIVKHLRIYMLDGRVHHVGLSSEQETLKMFKAAMDNGYTISLTSGAGNPVMFSGRHITCLQVCPSPIPVEENC